MFGRIRVHIGRSIDKRRFSQKNPGVHAGRGLKLRLPQYIQCGANVIIGEESRLLCWDETCGVPFEEKPQIIIGSDFHATRNFTIQCAHRVVIGDHVLIAPNVTLIDYNHGKNPLADNYLDNPLELSKGLYIEDGVWIGNNVLVMPGVTIGKKSIIGAGSVVTHDIPPYTIAVGNPAKVIKKFDMTTQQWVTARE